jgi:serine/threonine protein kinase
VLQPEQILKERYQLQRQLGRNAGRQTWLAIDRQLQEQVVVKLLTFGGDVQWDDLKLFEREAQVLQQLDHPCIPKYRDYFAIDDHALWFGLVQDYIPGDSLKDLLVQGKKFSETEVKQIATEILEILIYLHELSPPVLHRDIKPSNIIYGEDQKVYLVDFGAVQDKASAEGKTFTVVGTYGYAPIEQFGGRAVPASDLYALGATLIHLLTGISPAELPQENLKIKFKNRTSCDRKLVDWISYLIEPDVDKRPQMAKEAINALKKNKLINTTEFLVAQLSPNGNVKVNRLSDQLVIRAKDYRDSIGEMYIFFAGVLILGVTISFILILLGGITTPSGLEIVAVLFFLCSSISGSVREGLLNIADKHGRDCLYINKQGGFLLHREFLGMTKEKIKTSFNVISVEVVCSDPRMRLPGLYLGTAPQSHHIFIALTKEESIWLEQEIKDFLGLH